MFIFDKIPKIEQEAIDSYIYCFGPSGEDDHPYTERADLSQVLNEWDKSKVNLYKLLGNNLTISKSYTYALSENMMADRIYSARHNFSPEMNPVHCFFKWANNLYSYHVTINGEQHVASFITQPCTHDFALAQNAWPYETKHTIVFPSGATMKINKGMRVMKILAKFVEEFGDETVAANFEEFRLWHSRILQNKYIDGTLTLSVHPLDFMTMSDNANRWDSCMRWRDGGGDYRLGTVECMNSPYILVAYLHDSKHPMDWTEYGRDPKTYEWNSKQWRELFIINENLMTEVYPYPFQDSNITNTVLMWIKDLAAQNLGWTYDNEEINMVKGYDNSKVCPEEIHFSFRTEAFMYQDFGRMEIHRGRANIQKVIEATQEQWESTHRPPRRYFATSYGGYATCMWCGQYVGYGANEQNVFCSKCEPVILCACCGEVISPNNVRYFDGDDTPYCDDCFSDKAIEDSFTGEYINSDDAITIYWLLGNDENGDKVFYCDPIYCDDYSLHSHAFSQYFRATPKYDSRISAYYLSTNEFKDIDSCRLLFMGTWAYDQSSLSDVLAEYDVI